MTRKTREHASSPVSALATGPRAQTSGPSLNRDGTAGACRAERPGDALPFKGEPRSAAAGVTA
jgi:hypothetical protein